MLTGVDSVLLITCNLATEAGSEALAHHDINEVLASAALPAA